MSVSKRAVVKIIANKAYNLSCRTDPFDGKPQDAKQVGDGKHRIRLARASGGGFDRCPVSGRGGFASCRVEATGD